MPSAAPPPALSHCEGTGGAPTVIIVGAEPRKLVTIARSLHRAGVRCVIAIPSGQPLRVSSRAFADVVRLRGDITDSAGALVRLARSEGAGWVVPTSDSSLQIVCAAYAELSRICAVGTPPPAIVQRVLDKSITLSIAQKCGVPVPTSVTIPRVSDLDAALATMRFPIIAKPGDKSRKSSHDFKTRTFASAEELRAVFATQSRFGEGLLFQTYHGGDGVGIELLLSNGEIVTSFQHRRLSENPPSGGVAVVAIAEAVNPMLLDYSVRLLRALEWDGVAMVEFRHDNSDGRYRTDGSQRTLLGLAAAQHDCRSRLSALRVAALAGNHPCPSVLVSRRTARALDCGRARARGSRLRRATRGSDHIRKRHAAARRGFAPGVKSAMWSWGDPLPAIQEVATVLKRWVKDSVKAMLRAIIPRSLLAIVKDSRMLPADRRAIYMKRRLQRMVGATRAVALPPRVASVIFVCHGNIMRSAAAAGFLRDELRAAGITNVRVAFGGNECARWPTCGCTRTGRRAAARPLPARTTRAPADQEDGGR